MLLAACNPAPKYVKPTAPSPVAYKESAPTEFKEGKGWKLAEPGDDKIRPKWWELFNDPVLNALEEHIPAGNQSLAASEANYRAARALVVSARSALFPTIGVSPAYSNSRISATRGARVIGPGGAAGTRVAQLTTIFPFPSTYLTQWISGIAYGTKSLLTRFPPKRARQMWQPLCLARSRPWLRIISKCEPWICNRQSCRTLS